MADILGSNSLNLSLNGTSGNDSIMGLGGLLDIINGGAGQDIAVYQGSVLDYDFYTVLGALFVADNNFSRDGIDSLINIEYVQFNTSVADFTNHVNHTNSLYRLIIGTNGDNVLTGDTGSFTIQDLMVGFGGADTFNLGGGMDVAYGGAGNDTFNYNVVAANGALVSALGTAYLDGEAGAGDKLVMNFSNTLHPGMTAALAAFAAQTNKAIVFDFSLYDPTIHLKIVNIETIVVNNLVTNIEPTAVNLTNVVTSLPENGAAIKVANITIVDADGVGTNVLSLTGADAASFSIVNGASGKELWFNGGANFESGKTSYDVSVKVDDSTIAGDPGVSAAFHLNITNVNEEATAVLLNNQVTSIPENNATPIKVADIAIVDDALGSNFVSLTGADAASFTIVVGANGRELWFTGSADFESGKTSYDVSVKVDDSTIAGDPGVSAAFHLNITNVNEAPVAVADSASVNEDASVSFNVLANDTDVDLLDTKTVVNTGTFETAHGHLTLNADGSAVFVADKANSLAAGQTVVDSFVYTMADSQGAQSSATITLNITGVNDAPIANNDTFSTNEDTRLLTVFPNVVLANDVDEEPFLNLSAHLVSGPSHGTLVFYADGSIDYTPDANFNGVDSFTYQASDSSGLNSNVATVTINVLSVNDGPVAVADSALVNEDASVSFNVLANDTDVDLLDTKTVVNTGTFETAHGHLTLSADGSAVFVADKSNSLAAGQTVVDSFVYTMSDNHGAQSQATINVTVTGTNDAPVVVVPLPDQVLASGSGHLDLNLINYLEDVDLGDTLTFSIVGVVDPNLNLVLNGSLLSVDPILTTPTADYSITVRATDSQGAFVDDTFVIHVDNQSSRTFDATEVTIPNHTEILTNAPTGIPDIVIINAPAHNPALNPEVLGNMLNVSINGSNQYQVIMNDGAQFGQATFSDITPAANTTIQVKIADILTNVALYNNSSTANALLTSNIAFLLNGNDTATGTAGNDYINMGDGNDTVNGAAGNDTLVGGAGSDTFLYLMGAGSINQGEDHLIDFNNATGQDIIRINGAASQNDMLANMDFTGASGHLVMTLSNGTVVNFDNIVSFIPTAFTLSNNGSTFRADVYTTSSNSIEDINGAAFMMEGDDLAAGKVGDNFISGGLGDDRLYGDGLGLINQNGGNDYLSGGAGNDRLYGDAGSMINALGGNDTLSGGSGTDRFIYHLGAGSANQGVDHILDFARVGTAEPDLITFFGTFASQNDMLSNLSFSISDNHIVMTLSNGTVVHFDNLVASAIPNLPTTLQIEYADAVLGLQTVNIDVYAYDPGNDTFDLSRPSFFVGGDDVVKGWADTNFINGGAGNDTIYGDPSSNLANGNDTLVGGAGNDKFVYLLGAGVANQGVDHILDFAKVGSAQPDMLKFEGTFASVADLISNLSVSIVSGHYVLNLSNGTVIHLDNLAPVTNVPTTIQLQYNDASLGLQTIALDLLSDANDTASANNSAALGLAGDDNIVANTSNQYIDAGEGADTVFGDAVELIDAQAGNDVLIGGNGGDTIYGDAQILTDGRSGNDVLIGGAGNDRLYGDAETARVSGEPGALSSSGNDILEGGAGDDMLWGDVANRSGSFTAGLDVFVYNFDVNEGNDTIGDYRFGGGQDIIRINSASAFNSARDLFEHISINIVAGQYVMSFDSGTSITFANLAPMAPSLTPNVPVSFQIEYMDAVLGDRVITIKAFTDLSDQSLPLPQDAIVYLVGGNDVVTGLTANDLLVGGFGNDTLNGASGNDILFGENSLINGPLTAGNDILNGDSGDDTLYGDARIMNNATGGADTLDGGEGNDLLYGDAVDMTNSNGGKDTLNGGEGQDIIYGDALNMTNSNGGDDNINGGSGNDVIYGDVETLNGGSFAGKDTIDGDDNDDTIYGDALNVFNSIAASDVLRGGNGLDTIYGDALTLANSIGGDDTIDGETDNDLIYGDALNITNSQSGNDNINGGTGDDVIHGDGLTLISNSLGGQDTIDGGVGNDTIYGDAVTLTSSAAGRDTIKGGTGNDTIYGDALFMTSSTAGNDLIIGGLGDDTLYGDTNPNNIVGAFAAGADIFSYNLLSNEGTDNINDFNFGGVADTIRLTASTILNNQEVFSQFSSPEGILQFIDFSVVNGHYVMTFDSGTVVNLNNLLPNADGAPVIIQFQYDQTGTSVNSFETFSISLTNLITGGLSVNHGTDVDYIRQGAGNDTIFGDANNASITTFGDDFLDGGSGADVIYGEFNGVLSGQVAGDDIIFGGDGDDTLVGDATNGLLGSTDGKDIIFGGRGNDIMWGDSKSRDGSSSSNIDTFVFKLTDPLSNTGGLSGHDVIMDFETNKDILKFIDVQDYDNNGVINANDILSIANVSSANQHALIWFDTNQSGFYDPASEASIEFANKDSSFAQNQTLTGLLGDLTTHVVIATVVA